MNFRVFRPTKPSMAMAAVLVVVGVCVHLCDVFIAPPGTVNIGENCETTNYTEFQQVQQY